MVQSSFNEIVEGWIFCNSATLRPRWERARVIAFTDEQRAIIKRMFDRYIEEVAIDKKQLAASGEATAVQDIILQTSGKNRYAGLLVQNRFQVMEGIAGGSYYLVDHTLDDLVYRERSNGRHGEIMRFSSIAEAENMIGQISGEAISSKVLPPVTAKLSQPATGKMKDVKPVARKATVETASAPSPVQGQNSASNMFQRLIATGKMTDDQIFAEVQKQFNLDDSRRSYVAWYRASMAKKGLNPPAALVDASKPPRTNAGAGSPDRIAAMQAGRQRKAAERAAVAEALRVETEKAEKKAARLAKKGATSGGDAIVESARAEVKRGRRAAA